MSWDQRVVDRFFAKVQFTDDPFGCMLWNAADNGAGYGRFWNGEFLELAHRFAWRLMVGEIPDGLHLDHLCRQSLCVSWLHVEPVTVQENTLRGSGRSARSVQTGLCWVGHSLADAYVSPKNGKRQCRTCRRLRMQEFRARTRTAA